MKLRPLSLRSMSRKQNPDVAAGLVTLGRRTWTAQNHLGEGAQYERVTMASMRSGVLTLLSRFSSGKSANGIRIVSGWHMCEPNRPGIIFDGQGKDFRCMKMPGQVGIIYDGKVLPDIGEYRWGFGERLVNLTPEYLRAECYEEDEVFFAIPWTWLQEPEWEFLLLQSSDAKSWIQSFLYILKKNRGVIKSFKQLLQRIERAAYGGESRSAIQIPQEITTAELKMMMKGLNFIYENKYLVEEDDKLALNQPLELMKAGKIVVLNFYLDKTVRTKLYCGVILRQIYDYYNKLASEQEAKNKLRGTHDLIDAPWIWLEELAVFCGKPKKLGEIDGPGCDMVNKIVTQGMKVGFKIGMNAQNAHGIGSDLRENIFNGSLMLCNPTLKDIQAIVGILGKKVQPAIQSLDIEFDEYFTKEWLLIHEGRYYSFRPAAPMCGMHVRFKANDFNKASAEA